MVTGIDEWEFIMEEPGRTRIAILYSVDSPSNGQSPCDLIDEYQTIGITIVVITLRSSLNGVNCPGVDEIIVADAFEAVKEIQNLFSEAECELITVETPFNGGYERTDTELNDHAQFGSILCSAAKIVVV
eukprot:UN26150